MKLGDVLPRWIFREHAGIDLDVGGAGAHVFEVTDLTIPAGTDWNTVPHVLGSFTMPPGSVVLSARTLEVSALLTGTASLWLGAWWGGDYADALFYTLLNCEVDGVSNHVLRSTKLDTLTDAYGGNLNKAATAFGAELDVAPGGELGPRSPLTVTVGLTLAPNAEDIHVVRARAAFLVI